MFELEGVKLRILLSFEWRRVWRSFQSFPGLAVICETSLD